MGTYRRRPLAVEAIQFTGDNAEEVLDFAGRGRPTRSGVEIRTPEGPLTARPGHWIVRDVDGEHHPVKDSVFQRTYEPVEVPDAVA